MYVCEDSLSCPPKHSKYTSSAHYEQRERYRRESHISCSHALNKLTYIFLKEDDVNEGIKIERDLIL